MFRRPLSLLTLVVACALVAQAHAFSRTRVVDLELTLGTGNYQFRVNGVATFLVFVSYFDALDQSGSNLNTDLAYLAGEGVDGIRIFPNWWDVSLDSNNYPITPYDYDSDTLCDASGNLRSTALTKLLGVLDDAKDEGLIVDLSLAAETVDGLTLAEYTDCIEDLTQELENGGSAYKHVFFDLQNEYDNSDTGPSDASPMTDSQVAAIVSAVKAIDSARLVTASISSGVVSSTADNKADTANVDVVAWHEPRANNYWDDTSTNVGNLDNGGLPVYLQEPDRRKASNTSWTIADNWAENVYNAKNANADAWTLHNGGSFSLSTSQTLQSNLHGEEQDFLACLAEALSSGTCSSAPAPIPDLHPQPLLSMLLNWLSLSDAPRVGSGGKR